MGQEDEPCCGISLSHNYLIGPQKQGLWIIFKLPFWLHTQARMSLPLLNKWQTVPKCSSHFFSSFLQFCAIQVFLLYWQKKIVFIYEFLFLYTHLNHRTQTWQLRFICQALKELSSSVQPLRSLLQLSKSLLVSHCCIGKNAAYTEVATVLDYLHLKCLKSDIIKEA